MKLRINKKQLVLKRGFLFFAAAVMSFSALSFQAYFEGEAQAAAPSYMRTSGIDLPHLSQQDLAQGADAIAVNANNELYVSQGSSPAHLLKYSNGNERALLWSLQVAACGNESSLDSSRIESISVDDSGVVYVGNSVWISGLGYTYCIKKYASDGQYLGEIAPEAMSSPGGFTVSGDGRVYVLGDNSQSIYIYNPENQQIGQFSAGNGLAGIRFVKIALFGERIYATSYLSQLIQVFDLNGAFIEQRSEPERGGEDYHRLFVDSQERVYFLDSARSRISEYSSFTAESPSASFVVPTLEGDVRAPTRNFVVDSYQNIFVTTYDNESAHIGIFAPGFIEAPNAPVAITVNAVDDYSVSLSWEPWVGDPRRLDLEYDYTLEKSDGTLVDLGTYSELVYNTGWLYPELRLEPGTSYVFTVTPKNLAGLGPSASVSFQTTGGIPVDPEEPEPEPLPESTFFIETRGEYRILKVQGGGFAAGLTSMEDLITKPYMALNGRDVKFCVQSVGLDLTVEELIAQFESIYPTIASRVTDTPPCFFLNNVNDDEFMIWIPDTFDMKRPGTIVLVGQRVIEYPAFEAPDPVVPTVVADNSTSLASKPTLAKKPTFSGIATPGARITVTVHSDPVSCSTIANSQGAWSCTLPKELPAGDHTVRVAVVNPDETTQELGPFPVRVASASVIEESAPAPAQQSRAALVNNATTNRQSDRRQTGSSEQLAQVSQEVPQTNAPADDPMNPGVTGDETTPTDDAIAEAEQSLDTDWLWWILGGIAALGLLVFAVTRKRNSQES